MNDYFSLRNKMCMLGIPFTNGGGYSDGVLELQWTPWLDGFDYRDVLFNLFLLEAQGVFHIERIDVCFAPQVLGVWLRFPNEGEE